MSLLHDRMRQPVHEGHLADATGVGAVGNPACGDVVTVYLRCEPPGPGGAVVAAGFQSMGSAYQLATASVLCDCVLGRSIEYARKRTPQCVLEKLPDLPDNKRYLARLALEALQRALDDQERRLRPGQLPKEALRPLDPEAGRRLVLGLLGNGRRWGTREIEAMARADGHTFTGPTVAFLASLRREGVIAGEMDVAGRTWQWWLPGAGSAGSSWTTGPEGARDAGTQEEE